MPDPSLVHRAAGPSSTPKYNLFSLISFIGCFLLPIVGIVFGHVALKQISLTHEPGRGFARAGLVIGYLSVAFAFCALITYVMLFAFLMAANSYY